MTNESQKPAENISSPTAPKSQGCLVLCTSILIIPLGVYWLITGEVSIPHQGVYITGVAARIFAIILIIFFIGLIKGTKGSVSK